MVKNIAIYTLTSELHDEQTVNIVTKDFLDSLKIEFVFRGNDYSDYGQHILNLIYVRTGGTECVLKPILPSIIEASSQPIYLLTSGKSNSLAASMEILSYLRQQNIKGEILHGTPAYIHERIILLAKVESIRHHLFGKRLGVIGKPSDWLISSNADYNAVKAKFGIDIIDVPMDELKDIYEKSHEGIDAELTAHATDKKVREALPGALRIYNAIKTIVEQYRLDGFTIRCFDLLSAVHNTGCIALAKLNSEKTGKSGLGIIAGCEGDVPSMLTMAITQAITRVSGFQANPARINPETGEILFAHCTIPFNMLESYELDTHFESGLGVGIRGYMKEGDVTVFKVSGDLSRYFVAEGTLLRNQGEPDLCRTQQVIRLSNPEDARYFLTNPIGNHHIIIPGHNKDVINALFA